MDPLAPFESAVVEAVANDEGLDPAALRDLARRVHTHADSMPGVDELVMEWRRFLRYEPLVARTDDAYLLAVEPTIWTEFGTQLGLTDRELAAVRRLHDWQARRSVAETAPFDARAALVLAR
ncbi:hypothetical protein [Halosegnis sp.]|uniref:hypothetical protein n=1 Tax=Halosegnis sp. TaxID=2864959 RepID=UPI0035D42BD8